MKSPAIERKKTPPLEWTARVRTSICRTKSPNCFSVYSMASGPPTARRAPFSTCHADSSGGLGFRWMCFQPAKSLPTFRSSRRRPAAGGDGNHVHHVADFLAACSRHNRLGCRRGSHGIVELGANLVVSFVDFVIGDVIRRLRQMP